MKVQSSNPTAIENFYERGRYKLALRLSFLFFLVFSLLSVVTFNHNYQELAVYLSCTAITGSLLIYLYKTKNSKLVYYLMVSSGTIIAAFGLINIHNVIHLGDFLWMILITTVAFFGLGIRQGLAILVLNIGTAIYFALFHVNIYVEEVVILSNSEKMGLAIEISTAFLSIAYIIYQFVLFHKYAYHQVVISNNELINQNAIISSQNIENRTLVKEIHHRVKNNLQIVISLLRLHMAELKSTETEKHFSEAINRIMVMSLIHKKLYQEGELATIKLQAYLTDLAEDIISSSTLTTPIDIDVQSRIDKVGLKTIVPLGLIINELISNSISHAFDQKASGNIVILLTSELTDQFTLSYSDDGEWLEPAKENSSFGLELLGIFTEQLEGSMDREVNDYGTFYTFQLKNVENEESSE
ncbi:MAG: two-component sensor histidine kinase [Flavobacteriaceae bacterium]|jgi:two-component sensor histidine kinase